MKRVIILQEYVPKYRVPLFEKLIRLGEDRGISIQVAAGQPQGEQSRRGDLAGLDFVLPVRQRELRVVGRRLVFRRIGKYVADADLVILEQARRNIDAYRLLIPRRRSSKVALWGHGRDYVKKNSLIERLLQNFLTSRCDWFFAYTNSGAAAVRSQGVSPDRITVLRNSIDTTAIVNHSIANTDADLDAFRTAHDLTKNVAVFVGGLDESKRIPFLLEAAQVAHSIDQTFRLLVVGDGTERALVEEAAAKLEAVVYAGPIFGEAKTTALQAAKVIAMPGRVGLIAVDSFAAGRPIVTTDWPWHAPEYEYLETSVDSLSAENDAKSYAETLVAVMNDEARLALLQSNCRKKADLYSIEAMAQTYLDGIDAALRIGNKY